MPFDWDDVVRVIVIFKARDGDLPQVYEAIDKIIQESHRDAGFVSCEILNERGNDQLLVLNETWASRATFEQHLERSHTKTFVETVTPLLLQRDVFVLSPVARSP